MDEREFDKFADEYIDMHRQNIRISGEDPEFFAAYKVRDMAEIWSFEPERAPPLKVLDFGGGIGASAPHIRAMFPEAEIVIADVSRRSLEIAEARRLERVSTLLFDGCSLPVDGASFDLALAACVFHHIPEHSHIELLAEIRRVLKPGGHLFVFEHNPWNPLTVHAVNTCPFDENAKLIAAPRMRARMVAAGFRKVDVAFRIFFPGALAGLRGLERWLTRVPIGAQYRSVGVA
jgi:ubiquinone/menaquinone biosynthesis C-methylase UbiE